MFSSSPAQRSAPLSRPVYGALAALVGVLLSACSECPFDDPCPEPFWLSKWCATEGVCTTDGKIADCSGKECIVPPIGQLEIPLETLVPGLGSRKQLLIFTVAGPVSALSLDAASLAVTIDGKNGSHAVPERWRIGGTSVSWQPFPSEAHLLRIARTDEIAADMYIHLLFHDFACEQSNPEPSCGK